MSQSDDDDRDRFFRVFGVTPQPYWPDEQAPPLDSARLLALVRHELSPEDSREVCLLLVRFRTWSEAYAQALLDEIRAPRETTNDDEVESLSELSTQDDALQDGRWWTELSEAKGSAQPLADAGPRAAMLRGYLERPLENLLDELAGQVAGGVRGGNPLADHLDALRSVICRDWNWPARRSDPRWQDRLALTEALAEALADSPLKLPYDLNIVAAVLVKYGLDRLCPGH